MKSFVVSGEPILVEFRPNLRAFRGKLLSLEARGQEVHAASFLPERRIVLDSALLRNPGERDRILAHEIAHFIWWKAGSVRRQQYRELVIEELVAGVPGEMGWSAESRKVRLGERHRREATRSFREYLCESFCDTVSACILSLSIHDEITLPKRERDRRLRWVGGFLASRPVRI